MNPQDYKIIHLDPGKQPYFDQNQNQWVNVLFEGAQNEPIKWVVKDLSRFNIGDTVYGHIDTVTSQAGKPYLRFYRDSKPDYNQATPVGQVAGSKYQPRDDKAIQAQWAIGQAIQLFIAAGYAEKLEGKQFIEVEANELFAMIDRVKLGQTTHQPQELLPQKPQTFPTTPNQHVGQLMPPARQWNSVGQNKQEEPLSDEPMGFDLGGEEYPVDEQPFN